MLELYNIKRYEAEKKPRERLMTFGAQSLQDVELISLLIGSGGAQSDVRSLARQVLKTLDLKSYPLDIEELLQIDGIGLAKACVIIAALEFSRRLFKPRPIRISSPLDSFYVVRHLADRQENLIAINLNGAHEVLSVRIITKGILNRALVHPREVFAEAIHERSASIIIAHNHPSGDLSPSPEDQDITKRIQEAGKTLGIPLLDHIIFSYKTYFSFMENGDLV